MSTRWSEWWWKGAGAFGAGYVPIGYVTSWSRADSREETEWTDVDDPHAANWGLQDSSGATAWADADDPGAANWNETRGA